MNRDEVFGFYQCLNDLQFFLAGVTGNVEALAFFIYNVGTLAIQFVYDTGYSLFVAGDGRGRNDDAVTAGDVYLLVGRKSHTVKGRHIFTL